MHTGTAVVACNHGSNRSFLIASLFLPKWHKLSYEQVRQLMTRHRDGPDGPLLHSDRRNEPKEFLREEFCHQDRDDAPLMTRTNHLMRWSPIGCEYAAIKECADSAGLAPEPEPEPDRCEAAASISSDEDFPAEPEPCHFGTQTTCGHWADKCNRRCCNDTATSAASVYALPATSIGVPPPPPTHPPRCAQSLLHRILH